MWTSIINLSKLEDYKFRASNELLGNITNDIEGLTYDDVANMNTIVYIHV